MAERFPQPEQQPRPAGRVGYLFPAFPVFHQTFVLWEVLGMQRLGVNPAIYALRRPPDGPQQPEAASVREEVTYLPRLMSGAVLRANLRLIRRIGWRRYVGLFRDVVWAWRTDPPTKGQEAPAEASRVLFYDRVRGWYNHHPVLYLLKSLALVPAAAFLSERLRRDGVTHIHAQWASYPATVAYILDAMDGIPFSISAHAYDIYMVPRMIPAKIRRAKFVVTCAKANAEFLRRLAGSDAADRVFVSYHGVDVQRFVPIDKPPSPPGTIRIVSCGQLEHYKGMHHLVDACAALRCRGISLECVIIGEGPQRNRLKNQIESLSLQEHVSLVGALSHRDVAARLQAADVFVLASELAGKAGRRDVIANVIVEAMATGLAVVASRVPGVDELVDDGVNGLLVAPNSVEQLAEALEKVARDPDGRQLLGRAGREKVLRDFDNRKNVEWLAERLLAATRGDKDVERC